jgi:cell division protein FtsW
MSLLRPRVDAPLLFCVLTLITLGLVMVGASSAVMADASYGDPTFFLKRQLAFAAAGVMALVVAASIEPAFWERNAWPLLGLSFLLLVLVLIPGIGHLAGGSRRWLQFGPVGLQAGEVAKIAVIVYLAASLARKQGERMKTFRLGVLPHFVVPGIAAVLLLGEPDFGTAVLIAAVTFILLFVGGARVGALAGLLALAIPVGVLIISTSPYRMRRVLAFLDPWAHRYDIGYQITESLMTVGSGGLFGLGLGESRQKLFFLPAAHTDFIFAITAEELGFIGVTVVLGGFAFLGGRALFAALRARTAFQAFIIIGIASLLVVQATFNVAVALGLVPTKGITLPFVSYGGSSLVMSMFAAGILLRACADALAGAPAGEQQRVAGTSGLRRPSPLAMKPATLREAP